MNARQSLEKSRIIVIKIGTALVVEPDGSGAKAAWLSALVQDIKALREADKRVVIVSSGAIALGRKFLGISPKTPPSSIPLERKQAASAVGQYHLFHAYQTAFAEQSLVLAQVLLTMLETENRRMHLNARATLGALMENGIVPVINENDVISTGEIRFGDNDRLAARVAQMVEADAIVLLSTTAGLYTANPDLDPQATHIPIVEKVIETHQAMAGEAVPGLSTGGMKSKIDAAKVATEAGIDLMIANGRPMHSLRALYTAPETLSTLFMAQKTDKNARLKWLQGHMRPKGAITIDVGAVLALKSGKSLLPVGVKAVDGRFERGDVIEIKGPDGARLGMGISAYDSEDAHKIIGQSSDHIVVLLGYAGRRELVHRNDLALLA